MFLVPYPWIISKLTKHRRDDLPPLSLAHVPTGKNTSGAFLLSRWPARRGCPIIIYLISPFSFSVWQEIKKDLQMKKMHKDAFGVIQGETFWAALWKPGTGLDKCHGNAMVFCEMLWTTTEIQMFMNKVNVFERTMALPSNTLSLYQCWRSYFETSKLFIIKWLTKTS